MPAIPVSGLYIEIPDNAIPAPPAPSASIVRDFRSARYGAKSTQSRAFEPSGVKLSVSVGSQCRVRVEISAVAGHNVSGAYVYAGVARNGVLLDDDANLAAARVDGPLSISSFCVDVTDDILAAGTYEYELYFRQSSDTAGAFGYLGRRGQDSSPDVKTAISLTVYDP